MDDVRLSPIAIVHNTRITLDDDYWGGLVSRITLAQQYPDESLEGIDAYSHVEIIFFFHLVNGKDIVTGSRHPRKNPDWPKVGIFAQRARARPNRLGLTVVRVLRHEGRSLFVQGLDAVDGTPVLDIKPVMVEFLPREPIVQPDWTSAMLSNYWNYPGEKTNGNP
jgi:tRNA (adenine37-N6)-methyltransferase